MTNTTEFFVFKAKTNTEIITFHFLQTYKKCLSDLDSFIIYFIYCLFLKTSYIHCLCYFSFFVYSVLSLDILF